jgi:hypothetical protein
MKYKPRTSRPYHCFQHWKRQKLSVSLPAKPYGARFFLPDEKMVCGFLRGHRPLTGSQKEVANHSRSAKGIVVIEPKWVKIRCLDR